MLEWELLIQKRRKVFCWWLSEPASSLEEIVRMDSGRQMGLIVGLDFLRDSLTRRT